MTGLGHNGGPSMEPGFGFRKHAWGKARKSLMKTLPLEIVRVRVARAKRLGLEYKTYASIRATTGHDIVAFLFSGNALGLTRGKVVLSPPCATRLLALDGAADRVAAIYAPESPDAILASNPGMVSGAFQAPGFADSWSDMRKTIASAVRAQGLPADGVVLVPATAVEREWCGAGKLAGMIPAEAFFAPSTA